MAGEMLERMARAQFDTYVQLSGTTPENAVEAWKVGRGGFVESARAALQALKLSYGDFDRDTAARFIMLEVEPFQWNAMIDAVLSEPQPHPKQPR